MLTPAFFREDLAEGRLAQPFALVRRDKGDCRLTYPQARRRSRKIKAYRDRLLAALAQEKAAGGSSSASHSPR